MTDAQWFIWGVVSTLATEFILAILLAIFGGNKK